MSCLVSLPMTENFQGLSIKRWRRAEEQVVFRSVGNEWKDIDKVVKKPLLRPAMGLRE